MDDVMPLMGVQIFGNQLPLFIATDDANRTLLDPLIRAFPKVRNLETLNPGMTLLCRAMSSTQMVRVVVAVSYLQINLYDGHMPGQCELKYAEIQDLVLVTGNSHFNQTQGCHNSGSPYVAYPDAHFLKPDCNQFATPSCLLGNYFAHVYLLRLKLNPCLNLQVMFLDEFTGLLPGLNLNLYGMMDQLICSVGMRFAGTFGSTFTAYIHRIRGHHAKAFIPDKGVYFLNYPTDESAFRDTIRNNKWWANSVWWPQADAERYRNAGWSRDFRKNN